MNLYDLTPVESGKLPLANYTWLVNDLTSTDTFHTGEWQSIRTAGSKLHETHELQDVMICFDPVPRDLNQLVPFIDHSWADDHFSERVSGTPHNPPPSHLSWPYAVRGNAMHTRPPRISQGATGPTVRLPDQFDHTYPERFWPQHAGHSHEAASRHEGFMAAIADTSNRIPPAGHNHNQIDLMSDQSLTPIDTVDEFCGGTPGIRFHYGDLSDVVDLLVRSPLTRQAYLPVWFPEDTGAVDSQRVPCTLGYHFMIRDGKLSCRYYLRSCDIYRHFSNDMYLAARLQRWVCDEVNRRSHESKLTQGTQFSEMALRPSRLIVHIASLHAFLGDVPRIKQRLEKLP